MARRSWVSGGPSGAAREVPSGTRTGPTSGSAGAGAIAIARLIGGHPIDVPLIEKRDRGAAQRFFAQPLDIAGTGPKRIATGGHDAYLRDPRDAGSGAVPPDQPLEELWPGTGSSGCEAAVPLHATVRQSRLRSALPYRLRGAVAILPAGNPGERSGLAGESAARLPGELGGDLGHGRRLTIDRASTALPLPPLAIPRLVI